MSLDLPSEVDFVVIGTGITESIFAAACARIGYSVLHLDRNEYYSGEWASFNLQGIDKWVASSKGLTDDDLKPPDLDLSTLCDDEEHLVELPLNPNNIHYAEVNFHVEDDKDEINPEVTKSQPNERGDNSKSTNENKISVNSVDNVSTDPPIDELIGKKDKADNASYLSKEALHKDCLDSEMEESSGKSVAKEDNVVSDHLEIPSSSDIKDEELSSHNPDHVDEDSVNKRSEEVSSEGHDDGIGIATQMESMDIKHCPKWTKSRIEKEWRKFNLDLAPRVLYCGGHMVELLIKSDIAKYCEFKTVSRVLTHLNGSLEKVPCSRADVFSSKKVSMLEKRMLMKFLTFCADYENHQDEFKDYSDKPFKDFLIYKKLTENIKHYIQHSIAMVTDSVSTMQGLERTKKYLMSLGRYGNTAFLWPLYGSGELPQAFCRMCAVFGGVYCLRITASSLIIDKNNKCSGIVTSEGQKIKCKWIIMDSAYIPKTFVPGSHTNFTSRSIFLTDRSIKQVDSEELSLLRLLDPKDPDRPITILELPPSAQVCPSDMYVVHMTKAGNTDVKQDLNYAVEILFRTNEEEFDTEENAKKPNVLWSLYFSQNDLTHIESGANMPENIMLVSGPGPELDIDRPVTEAEKIFRKIFPDEDFLPKAPNPEDIIYVDDAEASVTVGQTDLISESQDDASKDSESSQTTTSCETSEQTGDGNCDKTNDNTEIESDADKSSFLPKT